MGPKANQTLEDVILYISRPLTIVSKQGFVFLAENIEFFIRRPATIKLPKILTNLNLSEIFGWGTVQLSQGKKAVSCLIGTIE